jgi:hypothetical protein
LRNFWTNLANPTQIHTVADAIERNPKLTAMMFLDPHRVTLAVDKPDQEPYYPCNKVGLPRSAFPTLFSFSPSIVFKDIGPGVIFDTIEDQYHDPNIMERERILGYLEGTTSADNITMDERHSILRNAMDANCLHNM